VAIYILYLSLRITLERRGNYLENYGRTTGVSFKRVFFGFAILATFSETLFKSYSLPNRLPKLERERDITISRVYFTNSARSLNNCSTFLAKLAWLEAIILLLRAKYRTQRRNVHILLWRTNARTSATIGLHRSYSFAGHPANRGVSKRTGREHFKLFPKGPRTRSEIISEPFVRAYIIDG